MGDKLVGGFFGIATAIVGVAIIAVIVSKNSGTASVLTAAGNAFSSALKAATGPLGSSTNPLGN